MAPRKRVNRGFIMKGIVLKDINYLLSFKSDSCANFAPGPFAKIRDYIYLIIMVKTDFLVIGSGIAGLSYALKVAIKCPDKKVLVITKTRADETNTKYAQGGIAGVTDLEHDSYEKHIEDTLIAGDGLCNPKIVEIVVKEGPERIQEMIEWGAQFDKDSEGEYKLGKEGGHSEFRILHHKDVTGREMERALLETVSKQKNIEIIIHWF